jgi:Divergent InlB B-repeat domain/Regulator of chromosome condensation (RCC1) repeat
MKTGKLILKVLLSVALIVMVLSLSCTIAAGGRHTVGLLPDGTVVATGNNDEGQCNVSGWTDIVHVAAGFSHTVGLKNGGTVVATGRNIEGQCNVAGWTNISMVVAGDWHTVGLRDDGTVVATGKGDEGQCDVSGWAGITQVAAGGAHTVGLKNDGTVVATGRNIEGQCNVAGWTNISMVVAGYAHTVGLKSDGTVVATGKSDEGQCTVSGWTNITQVAAGRAHTVGLKNDDTVVATGRNIEGQCDVAGWTNITQVAAGGWHTVGLKNCGTVVATGKNNDGQCDVGGWILETVSTEPPGTYHLTISSTPGGLVTAPGEGILAYCESEVVNLVAEAESGYGFSNWTGDVGTIADANDATTTITTNGDYFITANFEQITPQFDLTISSTAGGNVTEPGEGTFTYDEGTVVNLTVAVEESSRFVGWTGDVDTIAHVDAATTSITMNGDHSITANFEEKPSINWPLIGGIIGAVVVLGLVILFVRRR